MAALMRGTSAISTPNPTIKMPPNLKRQALANCDYTYTRMATTKGSKAKGKKRKKRGSPRAGASRWKERVQHGLRILQAPGMGKRPCPAHRSSTRGGGGARGMARDSGAVRGEGYWADADAVGSARRGFAGGDWAGDRRMLL